MKLSDIKGERTYDVIAELIDPIISIAMDDEASALFRREKCPDGVDPEKFAMSKVKRGLPKLIKGHKAELSTILATLQGVTVEEYETELSIPKLAGDVLELIGDPEFVSFFA